MIAYKGFNKGFICRGYQFSQGENVTEEANCAKNGFHSAENPLDCITYYGNIKDSVYSKTVKLLFCCYCLCFLVL